MYFNDNNNYPKIDSNIKDTWTVLEENQVGSENKSNDSNYTLWTSTNEVTTGLLDTATYFRYLQSFIEWFINSDSSTDLLTINTSLNSGLKYLYSNIANIGGKYLTDEVQRSLRIQSVKDEDFEIRLTEFGLLYTIDSGNPAEVVFTNYNNAILTDYGQKLAILTETDLYEFYLDGNRYKYNYHSSLLNSTATSGSYDREVQWFWYLNESSNTGNIYYYDDSTPTVASLSNILTDANMVVLTDKRNDERIFYIENTDGSKITKAVLENISGTPSIKYTPEIDIEFYEDDTNLPHNWLICNSGDCFNYIKEDTSLNSFIGGIVNTQGKEAYMYNTMNPYIEEEYEVIPLNHYKGLNSSEILNYISNSGENSSNLNCYNVTASASTSLAGYYAIKTLSSDSAYCTTGNSVQFNSTDFTISLWANIDNTGYLFSTDTNQKIDIYVDSDDILKVNLLGTVYSTGKSYITDISSWCHIVVTYSDSNNTAKIYVNNTLTNDLTSISGTFPESPANLNCDYNNTNFCDAVYLDFRIYLKELTEANIDFLFNSSLGTFNNFTSIRFKDNIDFSRERILDKLEGYFDSIVYIKDFMGYDAVNFIGGSKIISYNGNDFVIEMTFEYTTDTYTKFITQRDENGKVTKLFFIKQEGSNTYIYERTDVGNWVLVKTEKNSYIPLIQTERQDKKLQDVLFTKKDTLELYANFGDGNSIYIDNDGTNPSGLKGIKISNNNVLNTYSNTKSSTDIISSAHNVLSTGDINYDEISYCTIIDTIGSNGVYELFNINNTKINVIFNCLRCYDSGRFGFNSNCEQNLFINKKGFAIFLEGSDYTFNGNYFQDNTIKSYNGILYNTYDLPICRNLIIISIFYALHTKLNVTFNLTYSTIYGRLQDSSIVTNESTNQLNINPLFIDVENENFRLQHKARDYPINSPCSSNDSNDNDRGCYKHTYTNLGETNKEGFTLYGFNTDIMYDWKYPKEEKIHDYTSNILKYTGKRRRVLTLTKNVGELSLRTLSHLNKLYQEITPLRFYPNGDNHFTMMCLYTTITDDSDKILTYREKRYREYFTSEISLSFNFSTQVTVNNIEYSEIAEIKPFKCNLSFTSGSNTATFEASSNDYDISLLKIGMIIEDDNLPKNTKIYSISTSSNEITLSRPALTTASDTECDIYQYYFLDGFLKGFYLGFTDNSDNTYYMRIDENNEKTLYLRIIDDFSAAFLTFDITFTSGSNQAVVDTGSIDISKLKKGLRISGASVPNDTYIIDIDYDTDTLYLNYNATSSGLDTVATDGFVSFIDFMYVTYGNKPDLKYGLWTSSLQKGDLNSIELHELEDKYEVQSSMDFEIIE